MLMVSKDYHYGSHANLLTYLLTYLNRCFWRRLSTYLWRVWLPQNWKSTVST